MDNFTTQLEAIVKVANRLDSEGLTEVVDKIDKSASSLITLKEAQYVGVQGYWVRQKRCMDNCYRTKRAETDLSSQEIVFECLSEYDDSLKGDEDFSWAKYASEDDNNQIKTASKELSVISEDIAKEAKSLQELAIDLKVAGNHNATELYKIASELEKEAGIGDMLGGAAKGVGKGVKALWNWKTNAVRILQKKIYNFPKLFNNASQAMMQPSVDSAGVKQIITNLQNQLQQEQQAVAKYVMKSQDPELGKLAQDVFATAFNEVAKLAQQAGITRSASANPVLEFIKEASDANMAGLQQAQQDVRDGVASPMSAETAKSVTGLEQAADAAGMTGKPAKPAQPTDQQKLQQFQVQKQQLSQQLQQIGQNVANQAMQHIQPKVQETAQPAGGEAQVQPNPTSQSVDQLIQNCQSGGCSPELNDALNKVQEVLKAS